jgi:hypothetical protein
MSKDLGFPPNVWINSPISMHVVVGKNTYNELDNIANFSSLFIEAWMVSCNLTHSKLKSAKAKVECLTLLLKQKKIRTKISSNTTQSF